MDDVVKKIEMLDQFISNEKKSKRFTIISITILSLLGLLVFYYAYELNKSNERHNRQLSSMVDSLNKSNYSLNILRDSMAQLNVSLERNSNNYDSLKNAFDTLAFLFNNSQPDISGSGWNTGKQRLDDLSKITFNNQDLNLSDTLKKSILNTNNPEIKERPAYRIYIQCMPDYKELTAGVGKLLKRNKYLVPGIETIDKITFNPQVRYFHNEDLEEAKKIASLINGSDPFFKKNPVKIQKPAIKSPLHQLEIWIGEIKQIDNKLMMQQQANYKGNLR